MSRVMVVDDDEATLKLYGAVVHRVQGERPAAFSNPEAALAALGDSRPALVVVDYAMPEMDGIAFVKALRAMNGHASTPVLMLTAHGDRALGVRALSAGATAFLEKPISLKEFTAQLRRFISPATRATVGEVSIAVDERDALDRIHRVIQAAYPALAARAQFVRQVASAIGKELALAPRQLQALRAAALVYDVGMLSVPSRVRDLPSEVPARWRGVINEHVDAGASILGGSDHPLLRAAETVARTHHERFDGTGYPDGLAGDAIPLISRIIAVADTYTALVSERPHRVEYTHGAALAQIRRERGKAFDPDVVDALLRLEDRLGEFRRTA
jgi:response regulator RpfG family c-di-GMP phosphodiesterase